LEKDLKKKKKKKFPISLEWTTSLPANILINLQ
jgi:hypothetical protein